MALAQVQYTQVTPGERNFTVPFQYISRDHVIVSVNGLEASFTWLNPTTVRLAVAPQLTDIIDLSRQTERNNLLVTFNDGSTLTEGQLVLAAKQTFFIAQEAFDATGGTLSVKADGSYSASGRRIRDLGAPTADSDATTRKWVMDQYNSGKDAEAARIAAVAAEAKAKKWAENAENVTVETGKYSSKHHAIKANASAVSAANSLSVLQAAELTATQKASEASASASAAVTSATGAATSATASQASRVASETAKTASETARTAAIGARDTSLAYRDQTLTYRDTANSHKTAAETARDVTLGYRNTAGDHATAAATARTGAEAARNTADTHRLNAAASATASAGSATTADGHRVAAAGSADEAAGYAAGVNMPSALGQGGKRLRQKADETGLEYAPIDYAELVNVPTAFSAGMILLWSGSLVTVPSGWALCDGLNGTPNLKDRFVVGAGGAYAVGATGGASTVTLTTDQIPAHNHSVTVNSGGSHKHTASTGSAGAHSHSGTASSAGAHTHTPRRQTGGGTVTGIGVASLQGSASTYENIPNLNIASAGAHTHSLSINSNGAHTHTVSVANGGSHTHSASSANAGSGGSHENRPPYYALAYIMKL